MLCRRYPRLAIGFFQLVLLTVRSTGATIRVPSNAMCAILDMASTRLEHVKVFISRLIFMWLANIQPSSLMHIAIVSFVPMRMRFLLFDFSFCCELYDFRSQ